METIDVVVNLNQKKQRSRQVIVKELAQSAIEINLEEMLKAFEHATPFRTKSYLVERFVDQILATIYLNKSKDDMLTDISSGEIFEFRSIIQTEFCENPFIKRELLLDCY